MSPQNPPKSLQNILVPPLVLAANPHYYDYIHFIDLKADQQVEMVSGGGQALHRRLLGRYELSFQGEEEATLRFFDLSDVNPYKNSITIGQPAEASYQIHIEKGVFALCSDIPANIPDDKWPWLVFSFRLVFDDDPLSMGQPPLPPELAEHPETREIYESYMASLEGRKRYYMGAHGEKVTYSDIVARGLSG